MPFGRLVSNLVEGCMQEFLDSIICSEIHIHIIFNSTNFEAQNQTWIQALKSMVLYHPLQLLTIPPNAAMGLHT